MAPRLSSAQSAEETPQFLGSVLLEGQPRAAERSADWIDCFDDGQISDGIPDSTLVIVPEAGHLSTLEQPEAVSGAMTGFLDRLAD